MGFVRKGVLSFVCVLTFVVILIGGILLTLGLSLKYENVETNLVPVIGDFALGSLNMTDKMESEFNSVMKVYCQTNSEVVFEQEGYTFVIPCSVVAEGSEAVVEYGVNSLIKEIYYTNYSCDFWDCFEKEEQPTFLISEKAQKYWMGKFYWALIVLILLLGLSYFLVESKINLAIIDGSLFIVAAVPFLVIGSIVAMFVNNEYLELIIPLFSGASSVFWISLILGLVLLGAGIGVKLGNFGFDVAEKFKGKK